MNVIYVNVSVYLHIYTFSTPVLQIHIHIENFSYTIFTYKTVNTLVWLRCTNVCYTHGPYYVSV